MGATGVAEPQQAAALRRIGWAVFEYNAADTIEDLQGMEVALIVAVTQPCATIIGTLITAVKHWHFAIGYW